MLEKFKAILTKILTKIGARWAYSRCYDYMENMGIAVFGMCAGNSIEDYLVREECSTCPCFTPLRKDGADNG